MAFMAGKKILIVGLASDRSIAWGIAKAMAEEGLPVAPLPAPLAPVPPRKLN